VGHRGSLHAVAAVVVLALIAACTSGSADPGDAAQPGPQSGGTSASGSPDPPPTSRPAATPTATPSDPAQAPLRTLPRGGRTLFPRWRVIAYYGAAGIPAMGVLGSGSPEAVWLRLSAAAARFTTRAHPVLPAYELIAVIANGHPGPDGNYRTRVPTAQLDRYLAAARRFKALLILDVQPGRATFPAEVRRLERWLREPDVALALDPEWRMGPGGVPGQQIGSVSAAEINEVSAWLDALTARHRLPQKLLLVHQFTIGMVRDKQAVRPRRHLAIAFNMDGFGPRAAKLEKYRILARDRRFALGLKLFYRQDVGLFAPRDVVGLRPGPNIVEYQ
jgi:hypothetical protein